MEFNKKIRESLPVILCKYGSKVPFLTSIRSCMEYKLGPSTKCWRETRFSRSFSSEAMRQTVRYFFINMILLRI